MTADCSLCAIGGNNWVSQVNRITLTDTLSVVGNNIRCVVRGKERWELVSTGRRTSFGVKKVRFFQILAKLHCVVEKPTKFSSYTRLAIMGKIFWFEM